MATAIAGLIAKGPTLIDHAEYVGVSFPTFYQVMKGLGAHIELVDRTRRKGLKLEISSKPKKIKEESVPKSIATGKGCLS